jgi:hypothetical protein
LLLRKLGRRTGETSPQRRVPAQVVATTNSSGLSSI